ncbi:auxin-induced protein 22D-like [Hibiscus syriacus]|uniref:auxin-induced protein 22D-like n=1 Tax=Hibiscus syriacus TaxID=106335 RepID=UPI001924B0EF|nr:auxin-induced protein 22D-like [Hibiscus syriacus]XP_039041356.1 auxin-induced protein 22D-like [Hibiscus syriacus]
METRVDYKNDLNLMATELRLGLPGSNDKPSIRNNERSSPEQYPSSMNSSSITISENDEQDSPPPAKERVVGWPPIRSYRKNRLQNAKRSGGEATGMYVKVNVDGAPYLRKINLKVYKSYSQLLEALEKKFKLTIGVHSEREGYNGSDYAPTYEDKDGDWMLVGDVPWEMFICSCKRPRLMKRSEYKNT